MNRYRVTVQTVVQMDIEIEAADGNSAAGEARVLADEMSRLASLPAGMVWCGEWDIADDVEPVDSPEAGSAP
jgi:hypothetical protein